MVHNLGKILWSMPTGVVYIPRTDVPVVTTVTVMSVLSFCILRMRGYERISHPESFVLVEKKKKILSSKPANLVRG